MDSTRYLAFAGRLLIGVPFAMSGLSKLGAYGATTAMIGAVGLPAPPLAFAVAVAVELGGGLLLIRFPDSHRCRGFGAVFPGDGGVVSRPFRRSESDDSLPEERHDGGRIAASRRLRRRIFQPRQPREQSPGDEWAGSARCLSAKSVAGAAARDHLSSSPSRANRSSTPNTNTAAHLVLEFTVSKLPDFEGMAIFAKVVQTHSFVGAATELRLSKATGRRTNGHVNESGPAPSWRGAKRRSIPPAARELSGGPTISRRRMASLRPH